MLAAAEDVADEPALLIGQLALQVRRGRWPRQALTSGVEAGPGAYDTVLPAVTAE